MAKLRKQATATPASKSLKLFNSKSMKISRNKNIKTGKRQQNSPPSSINIIPHTRCALKLKRFKSPVDEICAPTTTEQPEKAAKVVHNKTAKCCVRLSRVHHESTPERVQQTSVCPTTRRTLRSQVKRVACCAPQEQDAQNKENTRIKKQNVSALTNARKQKCIDDSLKSSTPLKSLVVLLRREPFKDLNLQHNACEFQNAIDNTKVDKVLLNEPIITNANRESFKKLSLTKSRKSQQQKQLKHNIARFQPLRNSTLNGLAIQKITEDDINSNCKNMEAKRLEDSNKDIGKADEDTSSKKNSKNVSSPNLANKSDLIEQLLLSDNEDESVDSTLRLPSPAPQVQNKTHKFFHRTLDATTKPTITVTTKTQLTKRVTKPKKNTQKRRITQKGKRSVGNVYEFLSQSQTSDSDNANKKSDPAADVIKKLISEGKVQVATHKIGTGKLQLKRTNVPKKRAVVQRKQKMTKEKKGKIMEPQHERDDDDMAADLMQDLNEPVNAVEPSVSHSKHTHDNSAGGDSFSNLARSVLISQAGKTEKIRRRVTDQRKLLEAARKFVSTPYKKTYPPFDKTSIMSPILPQGASSPATSCASPWRVDDDAHLPSVFYFSRNNENLPSFSSDYIPSTPRKQQQHRKAPVYQDLLPPPLPYETTDPKPSFLPNIETENPTSPVISSFSSNDSNAENMPPSPKNISADAPKDLNESVINQRQQLNPLRALSNRNPLKAINILEVISLPPWCSPKSKENEKDKEIVTNNKTVSQTIPSPVTANVSNLFGFEEFLENDAVLEEEPQLSTELNGKSNDLTIRDKLQHLKHLRPVNKEVQQPFAAEKPISAVFDNVNEQTGIKQRKIKEMFCSTMINAERQHDNEISEIIEVNKDNVGEKNKNETNEASQLFIDPDPVTSFNEKDSRRTYVRPYKRKRKLRHNFVMFLDSDESGNDESYENEGRNRSGGGKVDHKKKKHRKDPKFDAELNSFVHDFNEICKEVDNYELIVE